MIKNTVIALVTAAALAGIAAPAMAATFDTSSGSFDDSYVLTVLNEKGLNATAVEQWGSSYLVAWVNNAEGGQSMVYLDPDSYDVVTP